MSTFRFKQFTVYQDKTPMKVNTDSVMLGAWCYHNSPSKILDLGTGTGLLALMVAQRFEKAKITAVEILAQAADEALYNFSISPWKQRIKLINEDFRKFATFTAEKFDLIISNPPYFENQLLPKDDDLQIAKHSQYLNIEELFYYSKKILNLSGRISLVLPYSLLENVNKLALNNQLFLIRRLNIYPNENKPANRVLLEYSDSQQQTSEENITIRRKGKYTAEYLNLTKDFYLFA